MRSPRHFVPRDDKPLEIEVKILEIDRAQIEKKLLALGAKKIFEGKLFGILFDFPGNTLASLNKMLRLRKEGESVVLTMKTIKSKEGAKIAQEIEVQIGTDFENMRKILLGLGLKEIRITKKDRVSFILGENHFDIDSYKEELSYIPEYMEIEGPNRESIFEVAEELGYSQEDCKPWTLTELAGHYGRNLCQDWLIK